MSGHRNQERVNGYLRRVGLEIFREQRINFLRRCPAQQLVQILRDGPVPQSAEKQALTEKGVYDQFYKTGGTPYLCTDVSSGMEEGLFLPSSVLNEARRALLEALTEERKQLPTHRFGKVPPAPQNVSILGEPKLIFEVTTAEQLTPELAALAPDYLYVPVEVLAENPAAAVPNPFVRPRNRAQRKRAACQATQSGRFLNRRVPAFPASTSTRSSSTRS